MRDKQGMKDGEFEDAGGVVVLSPKHCDLRNRVVSVSVSYISTSTHTIYELTKQTNN